MGTFTLRITKTRIAVVNGTVALGDDDNGGGGGGGGGWFGTETRSCESTPSKRHD